jgi:hypothetical protein
MYSAQRWAWKAVIRLRRLNDASAPVPDIDGCRPLGGMSDKDSPAAASRGDTMI